METGSALRLTAHLWARCHHEGEVWNILCHEKRISAAAFEIFSRSTMKHTSNATGSSSRARMARPMAYANERSSLRHARKTVDISITELRYFHLPFRRRERAMSRFRCLRSLQKFRFIHSSVHIHFSNLERPTSILEFAFNTETTTSLSARREWRRLPRRLTPCSSSE